MAQLEIDPAAHEADCRLIIGGDMAQHIFHAHDAAVGVDQVRRTGSAGKESHLSAVCHSPAPGLFVVEAVGIRDRKPQKGLVVGIGQGEVAKIPIPAALVRDIAHDAAFQLVDAAVRRHVEELRSGIRGPDAAVVHAQDLVDRLHVSRRNPQHAGQPAMNPFVGLVPDRDPVGLLQVEGLSDAFPGRHRFGGFLNQVHRCPSG